MRIRSLLTSAPVVVPLNGGGSLRLSPGATAEDVLDSEVTGNAKVDRLQREGVIEVETPQEREAAGEEQPSGETTEAPRRPSRRKTAATE